MKVIKHTTSKKLQKCKSQDWYETKSCRGEQNKNLQIFLGKDIRHVADGLEGSRVSGNTSDKILVVKIRTLLH